MAANVTVADHVTTKEDTSLTIKTTSLSLLGSHPGDFKLTSVSNSTGGTVSIRNGRIVFNPDDNFSGVAEFDYTVTDSHGVTKTATFIIDVQPVADAPVLTARQDIAEKVGGEFLVNTTTAGGQFQTSVTTLANGNFVIAWTDTSYSSGDADGDAVNAQLFDASGHKIGDQFLVNTETSASQRQPKTTALANGGFVIAWEDNSGLGGDDSESSVKAQVFGADGGKVGGEFLVNTATAGAQEAASITALSNGGFVVTWDDNSGLGGDDSESSVKAQVFDAAGNKVGNELLVNTVTAGWQGGSSVTALKNGGFVVSWEDDSGLNADGAVSSIKAQVFDVAGNKVGGEILVNAATARWQDASSITALANGGFVVSWEAGTETGPDDRDSAIRAQVFGAGGQKLGGEILVNSTTQGFQLAPSITALTNGGFVVVWEDDSGKGGDSSDHSIKAQVFDAAGDKLGGEFLVNTVTDDDQRFPSVAAIAGGGFIVSWSDASGVGGDDSGFAAKAQIFTLGNSSENTPLKLTVASALTDTDGSETLALRVSAIPAGATLSDGVHTFTAGAGHTSVDISSWTLAHLTITPASNFTGTFNLTFAATATDTAVLSTGVSSDSKTVTQTITVLVSPVGGVAPTDAILSGGTVDENSAPGTVVGTIAGVDPDPGSVFTYTLINDAGGRFAIDANTGLIQVANGASLDFETASSLGISVRVTDQTGLSLDKSFTINVRDVNEAPTNALLSGGSVAENSANGTTIAIVTGVDPDAGAVLTYALIDNAGGRFAIDANTGAITVANGTLLDFEAATSHGISVRVTDQGGLSFDKNFTIAVTNTNEAPIDEILTGSTVAENSANGTIVASVRGIDPDAGAVLTYALTDNAGGRFATDASTGVITIADGTLLDFETAASHGIAVRVTDQGGLTFDKNFTIAVTDVNEAPTDEILTGNTVAENSANGTVVGSVRGIDPDAGTVLTYALIDNAGGRFAIDAGTGVITVADGTLLDFETATSHGISVRVTDQGGLSFDKNFTIAVTNTNEAPIDEILTGGTVDENSADGTVVGTVRGVDANTGAVFSLTNDADGRFAIDANTGVITVADGTRLNFEATNVHGISVRVSDQAGASFDKDFTIHLNDVDEVATSETLTNSSIAENSANGTVVGTIHAADPDAGTVQTFTLTDNADGRFAINAATGVITVADGTLLDFETATSHDISVRVTDQGGLSLDKNFTIQVLNVPEPPVDETLSGGTIAENSANGTQVAAIHGVDPDTGAVLIYSLLDDAGGRFAINATTGVLTVANGSLLDFETARFHTISVRITDEFGSTFDKNFTINVSNVVEVPVAGDGHVSTNEDAAVVVTAASLVAISQDPEGRPLSVTAVGNPSHGTVSLLNGAITFTPAANFSGVATFDYTLSDGQGLTNTGTVTVDVSPVADTPLLTAQQVLTAKIGSQFKMNTTATGGQFRPSIASLTDGRFVATWTDTSRTGGDLDDAVKAQLFDANGNKIGGEFFAATVLQGAQNNSKLTALANGGFVITWEDLSGQGGDASGLSVRAQVFDTNGVKVGGEILANTSTAGDQDDRAITALANGGFVITWDDTSGQGGDASGASIKAQVFDAGGNKVNGEFLVNTSIANSQQFPSVAGLAGGGFVVTWADTSGLGGDPDGAIKGQRYDAGGNRLGSEFLVNTQTSSLQTASSVKGLANGGFVVVWKDFSGLGGDSDNSIKAQVFDDVGGRVGSEFLVNTSTPGAQQQPVITALANGDFVVTWTDFSGLGGDNSVTSIKAQGFTATGVKIGGEILVNTITSGGQADPSITASGPNGFLVAWTDTGTAGGVQAQLFTFASADENTALTLNVAAAITDTDGSETLALVASSIPVGATLSDGVNSFTATTGQTGVDISAWTLTKLTITPSLNFTGDFPLTFTATTTDHATLSSGAVTDTRLVSQTIDVIVTPVAGSGSGISHAAIVAGSNSNVVGSAGNDTLHGGSGNDVLTGGGGNDTYVFGHGGGQDRIVNGAPGNAGPSGELDFAAGIRTDQLWFQRDGNDLSIAVMGSQDKVTVADWFNAGASQLQEIKTADGSKIGSSLAQLVQAMATYSADHPGFDATATGQAPNDQNLQNTITASWHGSAG